MHRLHRALPLVSAVFVIAVLRASGGVTYSITNLGYFGTNFGSFSQAFAINSSGQVAGQATGTNGATHAFYYDGQMHDLGALVANGSSFANGINDQGVVVGQSETSGASDAFYIAASTHGTMVDMGTLPNGASMGSSAFAINGAGIIVGNSYHSNGLNANAFTYSGSTMKSLGDEEKSSQGVYYSGALAINASGVIVGEAQTTGGIYQAFVDPGTNMAFLPSLAGDTGSDAYGINASGVMVGQSGNDQGSGAAHAVYWLGTNAVASLGSISSNNYSEALAINDSGQIVGWAVPPTGESGGSHAFICTTNSGMTDLNNLITPGKSGGFAYLAEATAINSSGIIVGFGYTNASGGGSCAFIATPSILTGGGGGGGGGGSSPTITLNTPVSTNKQIAFNFSVTNLTNATFHLLQAAQASAAWTTNTAASLTTNTLNVSYRFTVTNTNTVRFYRVQTP